MITPSTFVSESLRVHENILQAIGKTPLIRLNRIAAHLPCPLYAKVEFFNPGGSIKDRIGFNIISEAERSGRLKPGGTVVESTSGNTGVGLAIVCALKGYKSVFVLPDKMSQEKIQLLRAFGARVVVTPTAVEPDDPRSYYSVARQIVAETPNAILANQYHNPENPRSHYLTTGPEIWEQTEGAVTHFFAGYGTCGTITGVAKYLKEKNPAVRVVAIEPEKGHRISGLKNFQESRTPAILDPALVDATVRVPDDPAYETTVRLAREESLLVGPSTGAIVWAALREELPPGAVAVCISPDSALKYTSVLAGLVAGDGIPQVV